jgi:hypothetical protein
MKARLYFDERRTWDADATGKVQFVLTPEMLTSGGTLPGRFLLECGDDIAQRFIVRWSALPGMPRNLRAWGGLLSVAVEWDMPEQPNGATSFNVYRALSIAGPWTTPKWTGWTYQDPSTLKYGLQDTDVIAGTTYWYMVSAVSAQGEGPKAGPVSATPTGPVDLPVAPLYFHAEWVVMGLDVRCSCGWYAPQQHVGDTFQIEVSYDNVVWTEYASAVVDPYISLFESVPFGRSVSIWLRVKTYDIGNAHVSGPSNVWHLVGQIAPVWVSATEGDGSVDLEWNAPVCLDTPTYYTLYWGVVAGQWIGKTQVYALTHTVSGLSNGVEYSFALVAHYNAVANVSNATDSFQSTIITATPWKLPSAPTLVGTAGHSSNQLNWDTPVGTGTFTYTLARKVDTGAWVDDYRTGLTALSFPDTGLTNLVDYSYRVRAIDTHSNVSAWSNVVVLQPTPVGTPPTITGPATSVAVEVGEPAAFSIIAPGATMFQWFYNDAPIVGATTNALTFLTTRLQDGGLYRCDAGNVYGWTAGNTVLLLVVTAPVLSYTQLGFGEVLFEWQPPQEVPAYGVVSYRLDCDVNGFVTSTTVNGVETSVLKQFHSLDRVSAEVVAHIVAAAYGVGIDPVSAYVSFEVVGGPTIVQQPLDKTVKLGDPGYFYVGANGVGTLHYEWFRGSTSVGAGDSNGGYTIPVVAFTDDKATFYCRITDDNGQVETDHVTLRVAAPLPTITEQPHSATPNVGTQFQLKVTATSQGNNLAYVWYFDGGSGFQVVAGVTGDTLTVPTCTINNTGYYKVVVSNKTGQYPYTDPGELSSDSVRVRVLTSFNCANGPVYGWDIWTWPGFTPTPPALWLPTDEISGLVSTSIVSGSMDISAVHTFWCNCSASAVMRLRVTLLASGLNNTNYCWIFVLTGTSQLIQWSTRLGNQPGDLIIPLPQGNYMQTTIGFNIHTVDASAVIATFGYEELAFTGMTLIPV